MTRRTLTFSVLVVAAVFGVTAGLGQMGLIEGGPTVKNVGETEGTPVQGRVSVGIPAFDDCGSSILYNVPANKVLRIDWMSVENISLGAVDPMDIIIRTALSGQPTIHNIVRLYDSETIGSSFFFTQVWSDQVRIRAQANSVVRVTACRNLLAPDAGATVTFHGILFDS